MPWYLFNCLRFILHLPTPDICQTRSDSIQTLSDTLRHHPDTTRQLQWKAFKDKFFEQKYFKKDDTNVEILGAQIWLSIWYKFIQLSKIFERMQTSLCLLILTFATAKSTDQVAGLFPPEVDYHVSVFFYTYSSLHLVVERMEELMEGTSLEESGWFQRERSFKLIWKYRW